MFTVVSQARLHKSKGANPFLVKAHLPLPPSPSSSSSSSSFLPRFHGKVTWIRVIESVDDRRERIKYRTGRAFDCRLRWVRVKRTSTCTPSLSRSTRRAFLSIHPPPLCIPRRLFSAYYSVQRGCKARLLLTVSSRRLVISVYVHASL